MRIYTFLYFRVPPFKKNYISLLSVHVMGLFWNVTSNSIMKRKFKQAINETNSHLSTQLTEYKTTMSYDFGNPGLGETDTKMWRGWTDYWDFNTQVLTIGCQAVIYT